MRRVPLALLASIAVFSTVGVPAAAAASHPKWESHSPHATWRNGGFIINNNMWNLGAGAGPQMIWADSYGHWGVRSTQPLGDLRVKSFPSVQKDFHEARVSSFSMILNGFAESMPSISGTRGAEAADDVWLNHRRVEVMIWVDDRGQTPSGHTIGYTTIYGQNFSIWHKGADYTFMLDHNESSGQTHILAAVDWLVGHGYLSRRATISQISFGWEIAYTDGLPLNFTMTNYWLAAKSHH